LRQLREQKHLTIQNVADKLYLDLAVIQAMEGDRYDQLPPPIFVRGYLRGYAKILEVPATRLLEKYDTQVGHKPPPPITPQAKPKKQATTNDLWVKVLTYAIFVTLMILMVLWGVNHYALLPSSDANNTTTVAGENSELRNGEGEYVPPPEGDDDGKTPTTTQPVVAVQPVVTPPPPVTPLPPPVDLRVMKIHYTKAGVWTQVNDAKGNKVYENTPKTGEAIEVKGEPPFKVKFGTSNAGIEIEYKGQKAAADTYPREPKGKKLITVGEPIPVTPPAPPAPAPHSPAPAAPVAPTPPTPPTR
jgi:cytoskeleton protein RodZ